MKIIPMRKRQESGSEGGLAWPRMRDRMDRLFQTFFEPWREWYPGETAGWMPDVDLKETDRGFEIRAEVPGMSPEDIKIEVQGGALTISGEKRAEKKEEKEDFYFSEIRYGAFQRTVELPETADPEKVEADYDKGVLHVRIGRKQGAAPKRITVKSTAGGAKGDGGPKNQP